MRVDRIAHRVASRDSRPGRGDSEITDQVPRAPSCRGRFPCASPWSRGVALSRTGMIQHCCVWDMGCVPGRYRLFVGRAGPTDKNGVNYGLRVRTVSRRRGRAEMAAQVHEGASYHRPCVARYTAANESVWGTHYPATGQHCSRVQRESSTVTANSCAIILVSITNTRCPCKHSSRASLRCFLASLNTYEQNQPLSKRCSSIEQRDL